MEKKNNRYTHCIDNKDGPLVVVHIGAGTLKKDNQYTSDLLQLINLSIIKGLDSLKSTENNYQNGSCVTEICAELEQSSLVNAGIGSNLNRTGVVELDAAIHSQYYYKGNVKSIFGSVAAIPNFKAPIRLALHLAVNEGKGPYSRLGLVSPLTLCSNGALEYINNNSDCYYLKKYICDPKELISVDSKSRYDEHYEKLRREDDYIQNNIENDENLMQDTVGAIVLFPNGNVESAVSSGGISLKFPGRIGEAAIYGSGCFSKIYKNLSIGISVSGTGEQIIKSFVAKSCIDLIIKNEGDCQVSLKEFISEFLSSSELNDFNSNTNIKIPRNVGIIVAIAIYPYDINDHNETNANENKTGYNDTESDTSTHKKRKIFSISKVIKEVWWIHTTKSFCIGYQNANSNYEFKEGRYLVSRLNENSNYQLSGCLIK